MYDVSWDVGWMGVEILVTGCDPSGERVKEIVCFLW